MSDSPIVAFDQLGECDLILDRVYKGGAAGNTADDPLGRLLPGVGNQGGFRAMGRLSRDAVRLVVLYTSGAEPDWPDELDPYTGTFTYFGDNRSPGRELHDTPRKGNLLLRDSVRARPRRAGRDGRKVPPFLLFDKPGTGRDVRFRGLLAPGLGPHQRRRRPRRGLAHHQGPAVPELPRPLHRPRRRQRHPHLDHRARRRRAARPRLPARLADLGGNRALPGRCRHRRPSSSATGKPRSRPRPTSP